MTARALLPLALAGALALTTCGDDDEGGRAPTTTTERAPATTTEADFERCRNDSAGYAVGHPSGWHTNSGEVAPACSYFHPEAFEVPESTEFLDAAVSIRREPVPFSRVTGGDPAVDVLERERTEVAGRPAVRRLTRVTGDALLEQGTRTYDYLVDLDGETLIASTIDVGDLDFERNREVLDEMMQRLELD